MVLGLALLVAAAAVFVPHATPRGRALFVTSWPDGLADFQCRNGTRRCSPQETEEKLRRIRPGQFFFSRHLGFGEQPAVAGLRGCAALWLEIPLPAIGRGEDFPFALLKEREEVLVNRFEGLAQELNAKDRFAVLANAANDLQLKYPKTLVAPLDPAVLDREIAPGELYLAKPAFGGAGEGIELFRGPAEGKQFAERTHYILQKFIPDPMTIDGYRFTLRLYAVITSVAPLRVYLNADEGIVKFTTAPFDSQKVCEENAVIAQQRYRDGAEHSHVSRNIRGNCTEGFCSGSRWDLVGFRSHYGKAEFAKLWERIRQCLAGAVRVALSGGRVAGRRNSFQVLGVDFDLDAFGTPFFLEANVTPALGYQTPWEREQKERLFGRLAALLRGSEEGWHPVS